MIIITVSYTKVMRQLSNYVENLILISLTKDPKYDEY